MVQSAFRGDIQGLRAIAILAVVAFHAEPSLLPGGFLGVDVFFVISGYLITGILVREIDAGEFSVARFYARRIARLFPALLLVLAATIAAGWLILPPQALLSLGDSLPHVIVFMSNLHFARGLDYFAPAAELQPLLHTWSLAIEEQFYIFFPPMLLLLARVSKRLRNPAIAAAFVASLAYATNLAGGGGDGFYVVWARAYELMLGALIALGAVPAPTGPIAARAGFIAGLGMIIGSLLLIDGSHAIPGYVSLAPCAGSGLVIWSGLRGGFAGEAVLANPVAAFFGKISYSLYLWHWPVFVYARFLTGGLTTPAILIACIALAIALATLSTYLVEQPILRRRWEPKVALPFGIATIIAVVLVANTICVGKGYPGRFDARSLSLFDQATNFSSYRKACHFGTKGEWTYGSRCRIGGKGPRAIAVWGDSFGVELAAAIAERQPEDGRTIYPLTGSSCPPTARPSSGTLPTCAGFSRAVMGGLLADPAADTVVLVAHYQAMEYGFWRPQDLLDAALELRAAGKQVYVVLPIPHYSVPAPDTLGIAHRFGRNIGAIGVPLRDHLARTADTRKAISAAAQKASLTLIDPADALCGDRKCRIYSAANGALYFDDVHLSMAGARRLVAQTALADLAATNP